ncbi:MAG: hypothetical protein IMZ61_14045 [Planctomycetes bacterium]|nr:hypothetical protein [Planctomycetota bacterium]
MADPKNPVYREHTINTLWQELIDRLEYVVPPGDFDKEINLALDVLQASHFPISYEILRIGCFRIIDAIMRRIEEEREENDG